MSEDGEKKPLIQNDGLEKEVIELAEQNKDEAASEAASETAKDENVITDENANEKLDGESSQTETEKTDNASETVPEENASAEPVGDDTTDAENAALVEGSEKNESTEKKADESEETTDKKKKPKGDIKGKTENPIRTVEDKSTALHAHNFTRKLHGVNPLEWDEALAKGACEWAHKLAETNAGLSHSEPLIDYGENIFISKGTAEPARSQHAVLLWYNGIEHFDYKTPTFNLASGAFSQVVWEETTMVGVGVAYNDVTKTTYIIARYSPPGNTCYADAFKNHVKQPTAGLPPKIPKIGDLIAPNTEGDKTTGDHQKQDTKSIIKSICNWCSRPEKPIESWSAAQTLPGKTTEVVAEKSDEKADDDTPAKEENKLIIQMAMENDTGSTELPDMYESSNTEPSDK